MDEKAATIAALMQAERKAEKLFDQTYGMRNAQSAWRLIVAIRKTINQTRRLKQWTRENSYSKKLRH